MYKINDKINVSIEVSLLSYCFFCRVRQEEDEDGVFVRLHTESLLVSFPVPDFSMPYNVICLTCTVLAIAFGSFHNSSTRQFRILDPNEPPLIKKITAKVLALKEKIFGKKEPVTDAKKTS